MAQKVTLIIPAAGDLMVPTPSSVHRPVWLASLPDGALTVCSVLQALDLTEVGRVILTVKQTHIDTHCCGNVERLKSAISSTCNNLPAGGVEIYALRTETRDVLETIECTIKDCNVSGPIYIKDCDGSSPIKIRAGNSLAVFRVTPETGHAVHNLPSKSFVETCGSIVTNIKEKHIISDTICVGGYGFESASIFMNAHREVIDARKEHDGLGTHYEDECGGRLFVSHVLFYLVLRKGICFVAQSVTAFDDWKSDSGWAAYCAQYRNVSFSLERDVTVPVCPDDATNDLATQTPLAEILKLSESAKSKLLALRATEPRARIAITTWRKDTSRAQIETLLIQWGIPFDAILTSQFRVTPQNLNLN